MSYMKVSGVVAALGTALALAGGAYGETGKSPNGAPGPAGNPNPPAAQPQANGPQGPAGNTNQRQSQSAPRSKSNSSHGKSRSAPHGKSQSAPHGNANRQSKGKSNSPHGKSQSKSQSNHANPNPGTPRKGGREDRPSPKVTLCHATRSETNPYVEITISENGLHGHGPAADPRHHEGSWQDIIPVPEGGCPTTVQPTTTRTEKPITTTTPVTTVAPLSFVAPQPEVAKTADQQAVLGVQAEGTAPADEPQTAVLGESASGTSPASDAAPASAVAAREADDEGSLPFTGLDLAFVLLIAGAALLAGFALRRVGQSRA